MKNLSELQLSVILPTLNEGENLKFLLDDFCLMFSNNKIDDYEILIMDDGSKDETLNVCSLYKKSNKRINLISRKEKPSLPMSIYDGIELAKYENVMWLDADGSMSADSALLLIEKFVISSKKVIIGSRFVEGGGYKGVKDLGKNSFLKSIKNVNESKDSVSGMIASTLFNKLLNKILRINIKDLTSGFIIGKKDLFEKKYFSNKNYGEYFIYLVYGLTLKKIIIEEVGYISKTRKYGESKTASSIFQLLSRGLPYLKAAYECRKLKNANF